MLFDYVTCLNCSADSLVPLASDICIKCGMSGALIWKDAEEQEACISAFDRRRADELVQGEYWESAEANGAK